MPQHKATPAQVAADIRRLLKDGGTAEHAAGVQWFFKEEIKSMRRNRHQRRGNGQYCSDKSIHSGNPVAGGKQDDVRGRPKMTFREIV
jgi:hypothetical protein